MENTVLELFELPVVVFKGIDKNDVPQELINFCEMIVNRSIIGFDSLFYIKVCEVRKTPKYWKIDRVQYIKETKEKMSNCSAICAIDFEGNIFKTAGYNAVANGVRGNIFTDNGTKALDASGSIRHLR